MCVCVCILLFIAYLRLYVYQFREDRRERSRISCLVERVHTSEEVSISEQTVGNMSFSCRVVGDTCSEKRYYESLNASVSMSKKDDAHIRTSESLLKN